MDFSDYGIDLRGRTGEVKTTCPQCSNQRKKKDLPCLNVNTDKGVWNCWHCGYKGGLGKGVERQGTSNKIYTTPVDEVKPLTEGQFKWFSDRKISREVIDRNNIGSIKTYMPQSGHEEETVAFQYYRNDELVNIKYRSRDKYFKQSKNARKCFYGLDDLKDESIAIICEGEMDKLSFEMAGFKNCISVPDGAPAPNAKNFDTKFEFIQDPLLDHIQYFYIAVDTDAPGKLLKEELSRRLGRKKCLLINYPDGCKDANDVLVQKGEESLKQCVSNAVEFPIEGAYTLDDFEPQMNDVRKNGMPEGCSTGWETLDNIYKVTPGYWTCVTGAPNSGKSEWLDALMVNLAMKENWVFAVTSTENQPLHYHATKLLRKYLNKPMKEWTDENYNDAKKWLRKHFVFVLPSDLSLDNILDTVRELVISNGVKGLVLDPFNELCHDADKIDTDYVLRFLSRLRSFAREMGVHVFLVAHPRKLYKDDKDKEPFATAYDISGSAHFNNQADFIISVYRPYPKDSNAATEIHVLKSRWNWVATQGSRLLWWCKKGGRYVEEQVNNYQ